MTSERTLSVLRAEAMFASPLFLFEVAGADALNHRLRAEVDDLRLTDGGVERSNVGGWHSSVDFFDLDRPGCREIQAALVAATREATRRVSPAFDFRRWSLEREGWVNVLPSGCCHTPHVHPTFQWSGVYYIAVPPEPSDRGALEFLDPRTSVGHAPIVGAGCFQDNRTLRPRAGQLVLFPSYVRHWVYPTSSEHERISVAFNARWVARSTER
jgi:uncharacterized protein (TIGR02466 family)